MVFFEGGGKYTLSLISFGRYWFDKYIYAIYTVIDIYVIFSLQTSVVRKSGTDIFSSVQLL